MNRMYEEIKYNYVFIIMTLLLNFIIEHHRNIQVYVLF